MNWGVKIGIFYSAFVIGMLTLVFLSVSQDFHLVSEDYYEKELNYQDHINKLENSNSLKEPLVINYEPNQNIQLSFPRQKKGIEGIIRFYNPTNAEKDKNYQLKLDSTNQQVINISALPRGVWKVQVDWSSNNTDFFDEKTIVIN